MDLIFQLSAGKYFQVNDGKGLLEEKNGLKWANFLT